MDKKTVNRKRYLVGSAILLSYFIMYIIHALTYYAIMEREFEFSRFVVNYFPIDAYMFFVTVSIFLIPFEKIHYIWKSESIWLDNDKIKRNNKIRILEACVFYLLVACILKSLPFYFVMGIAGYYFSILLTLLLVCILAVFFELFDNHFQLFAFSHIFIILNGIMIYSFMDEFMFSFIFTFSLSVAYNICYLMSDRNNKLLQFCCSLLVNISTFIGMIFLFDRVEKLYVWLQPENYTNGLEHLMLKDHTLQLGEHVSWGFALRHDFSSLYSYLGVVPLCIFIFAFIVLTICIIYCGKLMPRKRYCMLLFLYFLIFMPVVYCLLADFGYVPTASMASISFPGFIWIAAMLRLLIVKKVPQDFIEKYDCKEENIDIVNDKLMEHIKKPLLLVVDMQNVYSQGQKWECKNFHHVLEKIILLLKSYKEKVIFTRYIASNHPKGIWADYNIENEDVNSDEWLNKIVEDLKEFQEKNETYDKSVYSSYSVEQIKEIAEDYSCVIVTGVVAECCVLSTVMSLIDAGVYVIYLQDAIAGVDNETEEATIKVLKGLSPLHLSILTTEEYLNFRL
ncbi:MAG: cysteine hydrolase family protein [Lachnospiraceae bacterium]